MGVMYCGCGKRKGETKDENWKTGNCGTKDKET